jgi:hypothetical protein
MISDIVRHIHTYIEFDQSTCISSYTTAQCRHSHLLGYDAI